MKKIKIIILPIFIFFLFIPFLKMRHFGKPEITEMDDYFLKYGQEETGSNNVVSSIVFDYRGLDTLGEATVLFTAALGISLILQKNEQNR